VPPRGTRAAFEAALDFFNRARTSAGEPVTFLLDEFLELRTFESFPGLRRVVHDFIAAITASGNRFVLTSRYVFRTLRLLACLSPPRPVSRSSTCRRSASRTPLT